MDEQKKQKLNKILLFVGLGLLIVFVVITSIVVNYKKNELENLKKENDKMEETLKENEKVEQSICVDNEKMIITVLKD